MNHTALGRFIHRTSFSTKARSLVFFTEQEGLSRFLLYPSKKQPPLIPLACYDMEYKSNASLNTIQRFTLLYPKDAWFSDPQRLTIAFFFCDVIRQTSIAQNTEANAYHVIAEIEERLMTDKSIFLLPLVCLSRWMEVLGFLPEPVENARYFDISEGVFLANHPNNTLGAEAWNTLLLNQEVADKKALREAFYLMIHYLEMHIPNFNVNSTLSIIQQILL